MTVPVTVTPDGFRLGDQTCRLLSGEVHFWRLDPADWPRVLDAVQELGFDAVSTYVSWARHERAPGSYDFSGRFDVEAFLALVHERGLRATVRVGPTTCAEQEDAGWPARVLEDPACQARRPGGLPYLLATATGHAFMPSFASETTLAAVAGWYDEVLPRLAPLQWPAGPIIGVQVDNEMGFHFQSHAFALDYHPDALAQWSRFLAKDYGDIGSLNAAYGMAYDEFDSVPAPRDGTDEPEQRRVDWVRFREHHLRESLGTLAAMVRARGIDRVPLLHNDYPRTTTPLDLGSLERAGAIDLAGADIYVTKEGGRAVRELARHLAGSSRLPYMAELGTGWLTLPWLLPMSTTPLDEEHAALRAFVHGVRAANVYMLVERDRWYGSPISGRGEAREPKATFYRRLHRLLDELDWSALRRDVRVLVVENRDVSRRVAGRAVLGDVVPCFSQLLPVDLRLFSPDDDEADAQAAWDRSVTAELERLGVECDRASSSALPDLSSYDVVAVMEPVPVELAGIDVVSDPAALADRVPPPVFRRDRPEVDLVRLTGGGREVLAAVNGCGEALDVTIESGGPLKLTGRWYDETLTGDGAVVARLQPWATQVWEVTR